MAKKINIIIVDDHPFIIEGYKNAINSYNALEYEFTITQANNCRSAYDILINPQLNIFDIAFFDISMPAYEEKNIFSGEDLALLMKEQRPQCKVILLTMHSELIKINTIIKTINPRGLVIKNDLTFDELLIAFDRILKGDNYYSQTVVKLVSQSQFDNIEIDLFDKQILYHLSRGTKAKDLSSFVPLSVTAVENRKSNLKEMLQIGGSSDAELIAEAHRKGMF